MFKRIIVSILMVAGVIAFNMITERLMYAAANKLDRS